MYPSLKSPPYNPPCPGGGGASLHCFARQYLLWWFVFHICHTHFLALLSHYFKSVVCVYSVIFSVQRRCTGCRVPFSDARCFLPVTVCGTTHAHLVYMCWGGVSGTLHMRCAHGMGTRAQSPPGTIYNSSPSRPSPGEVVQIPNTVRARCGYFLQISHLFVFCDILFQRRCTHPPCNSHALVQATVGVGTVLIWYLILIRYQM